MRALGEDKRCSVRNEVRCARAYSRVGMATIYSILAVSEANRHGDELKPVAL